MDSLQIMSSINFKNQKEIGQELTRLRNLKVQSPTTKKLIDLNVERFNLLVKEGSWLRDTIETTSRMRECRNKINKLSDPIEVLKEIK
jgi:hypothetical protein